MKTKQSIEEKIHNKIFKMDLENGSLGEAVIKLIKSLSFKDFTELKGYFHQSINIKNKDSHYQKFVNFDGDLVILETKD